MNKSPIKNPKRASKVRKKGEDDLPVIPMAIGAAVGNMILPGIGGAIAGGFVGGIMGSNTKKDEVMARIPVFYSFHFGNDVMRVQQVRNIGSIEGNSPTSPNEWEKLKRTGKKAVENWIHENMKYKRCIIVLIGSETFSSEWVKHEIIKAWNDGKALLGIHIHNLKCPRNGTDKKGKNPFDLIKFKDGSPLSKCIPCYDPNSQNAYQDIANNISHWINHAIKTKAN